MSGFWRLNGIDLTAASVSVKPTKLVTEQRFRQVKTAIHLGTQVRELVGLDLATVTVEIAFLGRGTAKWDELAYVQGILDTDEVWTLEAPSDLPVFSYKNYKRVPVSTDSWTMDPAKATSRLSLTIQGTVNGVWVADGGSYCESITGYFTLQAGGTWLRSDGVNTGTTPKVRLPQQVFGYALGVNSVYQTTGVPNVGSATVGGLPFDDFDVTGFLHPLPTVAGATGIYELCSAPTLLALGAPVVPPPLIPLSGSILITGSNNQQGDDFVKDNGHGAIADSHPATEGLNITNT